MGRLLNVEIGLETLKSMAQQESFRDEATTWHGRCGIESWFLLTKIPLHRFTVAWSAWEYGVRVHKNYIFVFHKVVEVHRKVHVISVCF